MADEKAPPSRPASNSAPPPADASSALTQPAKTSPPPPNPPRQPSDAELSRFVDAAVRPLVDNGLLQAIAKDALKDLVQDALNSRQDVQAQPASQKSKARELAECAARCAPWLMLGFLLAALVLLIVGACFVASKEEHIGWTLLSANRLDNLCKALKDLREPEVAFQERVQALEAQVKALQEGGLQLSVDGARLTLTAPPARRWSKSRG
jgi:polyhydroxyalkanoate synthesis regulator phasin